MKFINPRRFFCALLIIAALGIASPAGALSRKDVAAKLQSITAESGYEPGTGAGDTDGCWRFVNKVCNQVYGYDAPGGTSGYELTRPGKNWALIGQATGVDGDAAIVALLKTAAPGDVVQYKNSYAKWQHTAVVFAVNDDDISIYDYVDKRGVALKSHGWDELCTREGMGMFDKAKYGISLYRSTDFYVKVNAPELAGTAD